MMSGMMMFVVGVLIGATFVLFYSMKKVYIDRNGYEERIEKQSEFYEVLVKWIKNIHEGWKIDRALEEMNYKNVAIYGMKELGELLYDELKDSGISVDYIIDKRANKLFAEVEIVTPDDTLKPVDAIIVTAIHYYDDIEKNLSSVINCPILSLRDLILTQMD